MDAGEHLNHNIIHYQAGNDSAWLTAYIVPTHPMQLHKHCMGACMG